MQRIIVSVTNDLSTDQRVEKVCSTFVKNGFDILLVGRLLKNSKPLNRAYKTKRFKLFFNNGFLFYAEYNIRLFCLLLFSKKDILLSNDLDTLLPNYLVSKLQNKKLVYDSHELFPEVPELVKRPLVKKVWTFLESNILPILKNNYTVCDSIAKYYKEKYNTNFNTIKNLPNLKTIDLGKFPFETQGKKIIIYQGAINLGRGLELMIESMKFLNNHLLVIIGSGDITKELQNLVELKSLQAKVKFLGRIEPKELHQLTPLASLGISFEEDLGLNYRYALPNKIFDYIQAEVPILVSNLPEMKQIVKDFKVGEILMDRNPKSIAKQIESMSEKDYSIALEKARKELIWENQEQNLLSIFNNLS